VVLVDLPGHGDSAVPPADDDVSMTLMLDALREVRNSNCQFFITLYS